MSQDRAYMVESCVTSLAQAVDAQTHGADRVELCIRLETEGMTPDFQLVGSLCDQLDIPVRVMVRATTSGFEVDEHALQQMIESIQSLKVLPLDGFVLGVLKNNCIDRDAMQTLLQHAHPFPVTFHKAIDLSTNLSDDIEWLNQISQVDTILTSGGEVKAIDGVHSILSLKSIFKGHVMAAGKITPQVLPGLHEQLLLQWYHGRAIF